MGRVAVTLVTSLAITFLNPATAFRFTANDETAAESVTSRPLKNGNHYSNVHHTKEWVAGPNGYLYQFHAGDQSWLAAREFCLSQNSDLVVLRDGEQIDWLRDHYAPTYARFAERYIQIGLMIPDGPMREWTYLDGSKYNQSVITWMSGEPFDHSADGLERCALLRVHARVLDDVDCEATPRNQMPVRFICERSGARHKEQQLSKNFIWGKLEQLFDFFGFATAIPPKKSNITDDDDEDYIDAINKYNATSTERKMLRKLKVFETSSEEEREVLEALRSLNKPGTTDRAPASGADEVTSPDSLQEARPQTSTEIEQNGSTTPIKTQSKAEELSTTTAQEETETASNALPSTEESKKLTTEEGTTESPAVDESTSEASSKAASFTGASTTEEKTSEQAGTEESTTEVPTTLESVSQSSTAAESTTEGSSVEKADNASVRAHAVPLREITEVEGSGTTVERSQVEKESKPIRQTEIDPEKLEKIINTMEKMVANLENISIVEKGKETKLENDKDSMQKEKEIRKKEETKEDSQKSETNKKEKPIDSLVRISEKVNDGAGQAEMEKDFDEKLNQNMPTTDIKPPVDEDCEEEGSGEKSTTQTPSEAVVKNVVDTEDVDDLGQKPKIPAGKEEHIQDFLRTLRTFLSRAEHNDLRKLLDDNPGKTLLEKMKLAIAAANEREFSRLKELELMKKHGVDISNVPEPRLIADSEREDLFKKISGVVMEEAEKEGLETATEPSARTTTQETLRTTAEAEETPTSVQATSSKEGHSEWNQEKKNDKGISSESIKEDKNDESLIQNPSTGTANNETTAQPKTSAEIPVRTVQLKEFDNKEEIMSREAILEAEEKRKEDSTLEKKSDEEGKNEEDEEKVKTEPIKSKQGSGSSEGGKDDETSTTSSATTQSTGNSSNEKKSMDDDEHDSDESKSSKSREEKVGLTTYSKEVPDDRAPEVGTEKTPAAKRAERRRLAKEKEAQQKKDKGGKTTSQQKKDKGGKTTSKSSSEEDSRDKTNPLGLPTLPPLPPPPTLAPSLQKVLDNIGEQWRKLFPPPKVFRL